MANRLTLDWDEHVRSRRRGSSAAATWTTCRSRELAQLHRLDVLLLGVGAEGSISRHPLSPRYGAAGARALRRSAGAAGADHRREAAHRQGRLRLLACRERRRRHRRLQGRVAARGAHAAADAAAAGGDRGRTAESLAGRLHRASRQRRARLHRRVRGDRGHRRRRAGPPVRAAITTTTTRSW